MKGDKQALGGIRTRKQFHPASGRRPSH